MATKRKTKKDVLPEKKKRRPGGCVKIIPDEIRRKNLSYEPPEIVTQVHPDLNSYEMAFVLEYSKDWNATRSYQSAFPKVKRTTASVCAFNLLRQSRIKEAIRAVQRELVNSRNLTRSRLLDEALDVYYKAKSQNQLLVAIKALELIARMAGFIQNKWTVDGNVDVNHEHKNNVLVKVTEKDLPLESREKLLELIRKQSNTEEENTIDGQLVEKLPETMKEGQE